MTPTPLPPSHQRPRNHVTVGASLAWAAMGAELAGMMLAVYDKVVVGSLLLVLGVVMALVAVRLVPKSEDAYAFVVGALKTTLLLLSFAVFLLVLLYLAG